MVCSSPVLRAQGQPSSSQDEPSAGEPDLLWLVHLTGAHIGLAPISQDPEDRCTIWENLVSLVDFQCPGFPLTSEELCHYIDIPRTPAPSRTTGRSAVTATPPPAVAWPPQLPADIDYKTNSHAKPPYSYATLICMAMEDSKEPKLTLAAICKWISDNFCYYRRADPSWQSSIRHNLCINRRFVKVPRRKGEPGRGAFWKLHPQYAKWLKSSPFKGRRAPAEHVLPATSGSAQQGEQRVPSPAAPAGGSQGSLEVSAELQRLLREFEEFESSRNLDPAGSQEGQQRPAPPAEASWLPSCASGSPEELPELTELAELAELVELTELTELKGSSDWETLLNNLPEQGDFSSLEDLQLPSPSQPGMSPLHLTRAQEQHLGWPQGQQQVLPEPGLDETLTAAAFLEAAWHEGTSENLSTFIPMEQGAENIQTSLLDGDFVDWGSLTDLNL